MQWYYYGASEGTVGPISEEGFQDLVNNGTIKPETFVWKPTMTDWQKYGEVVGDDTGAMTPPSETAETHVESVCSECGKAFSREEMIRYGDSWVCAACKPVFVQKLKEGMSVAGEMAYAGFWIRFGAKFIDWIVIAVLNMGIGFVLSLLMSTSPDPSQNLPYLFISNIGNIAIAAAYTTWLLGRYGATLGKMACGIKVVTPDGGKISYLRAFGRHFAEFLSGMILLIGYIMAAFDSEKRALHDRICSTRVVKKQ